MLVLRGGLQQKAREALLFGPCLDVDQNGRSQTRSSVGLHWRPVQVGIVTGGGLLSPFHCEKRDSNGWVGNAPLSNHMFRRLWTELRYLCTHVGCLWTKTRLGGGNGKQQPEYDLGLRTKCFTIKIIFKHSRDLIGIEFSILLSRYVSCFAAESVDDKLIRLASAPISERLI